MAGRWGTTTRIRLTLMCTWLVLAGLSGCNKHKSRSKPTVTGPDEHFTTVTLKPPNRNPVRVRAELALSEPQRSQGLMYRGKLDPGTGMLFVFPTEQVQYFWMQNTYIPLDMVFIDSRKVVVGVVHQARPLTTELRGVGPKPCRYVLEVNGGFARKNGVVAGTRVEFKLPGRSDKK